MASLQHTASLATTLLTLDTPNNPHLSSLACRARPSSLRKWEWEDSRLNSLSRSPRLPKG
jgi:hypothetical protein